jgi:hypothetical protein
MEAQIVVDPRGPNISRLNAGPALLKGELFFLDVEHLKGTVSPDMCASLDPWT